MLNSNTFHAMCHAIQAVRLLCAVTYEMYNAFLTQYMKLLRAAQNCSFSGAQPIHTEAKDSCGLLRDD